MEPAVAARSTRLRATPVAHSSDRLRRDRGIAGLRPYPGGAPLSGTAPTVRTRPGGDLAILRAFDLWRPGHVVVVAADGECANARAGGVLCLLAETIGLTGLVLDGAVRDVAERAACDFPVWPRGRTQRGPREAGRAAIDLPIPIGGAPIRPGDVVMREADGPLVFPGAEAETPIARAEAQRAREEATVRAIRAGTRDRSLFDALEARAAPVEGGQHEKRRRAESRKPASDTRPAAPGLADGAGDGPGGPDRGRNGGGPARRVDRESSDASGAAESAGHGGGRARSRGILSGERPDPAQSVERVVRMELHDEEGPAFHRDGRRGDWRAVVIADSPGGAHGFEAPNRLTAVRDGLVETAGIDIRHEVGVNSLFCVEGISSTAQSVE